MVTRIGPKRPHRLFIAEWRQERGLSQEQLAERINSTKATISRYEKGVRRVGAEAMAALNEALQADIRRNPATPSADELLRNASPEVREQAIRVIEALVAKKAS